MSPLDIHSSAGHAHIVWEAGGHRLNSRVELRIRFGIDVDAVSILRSVHAAKKTIHHLDVFEDQQGEGDGEILLLLGQGRRYVASPPLERLAVYGGVVVPLIGQRLKLPVPFHHLWYKAFGFTVVKKLYLLIIGMSVDVLLFCSENLSYSQRSFHTLCVIRKDGRTIYSGLLVKPGYFIKPSV